MDKNEEEKREIGETTIENAETPTATGDTEQVAGSLPVVEERNEANALLIAGIEVKEEGNVASQDIPSDPKEGPEDGSEAQQEAATSQGEISSDSIQLFEGLKMLDEEFDRFCKPLPPALQSPHTVHIVDEEKFSPEELLYDLITKTKSSTIFVETEDAICEQAINIMKGLKMPLYVVHLDRICDGENVKNLLFDCSKRNTLPIIFINGQLIGGYLELWYLYFTDLINGVLAESGSIIATKFTFGYDLIVIGGGAVGITAALEAAQLKKKVALINYVAPTGQGRSWELGGTGLNAGSLAKLLLHTAASYGALLGDYNVEQSVADSPDWQKLMSSINEQVMKINFSLRCQLKEAGVQIFNARGRFEGPHEVELSFPGVGEKKMITGGVVIVSTGSRPRCPRYFPRRLQHCLTTDDFFREPALPGKTLVIAASYVGLEAASILASFHYSVTLLVEPPIVKDIDWEILRRAKSHMKFKKITFWEKIQIENITKNTDPEINLRLKVKGVRENKTPLEEYFDTVLFDFGRVPNTNHLGLCKIGINVNSRTRKIIVDDQCRTNIKHILAAGDVVDGWPELASAAKKGGKLLIQKLYKGHTHVVGTDFAPQRILLPVEYGKLGSTEQSALVQYGKKVKCYEAESQLQGCVPRRGLKDYVYLKVICVQGEEEEKVIGIHLMCTGAAEKIQGLAILLRKGLTKKELDNIYLESIFCEVMLNPRLEEVLTPSDIYKACREKGQLAAVERALGEVGPLRKRLAQAPETAYFPLDTLESDDSEKERMRERNKPDPALKRPIIQTRDVRLGRGRREECKELGSSSGSSSTTTSTSGTSCTAASSCSQLSSTASSGEEEESSTTSEEEEEEEESTESNH